jgi:hypothetical protein
MQIPGMPMLTTVDPENIKAILATQFNDFGKGIEFHDSWKYVYIPLEVSDLVSWGRDIQCRWNEMV